MDTISGVLGELTWDEQVNAWRWQKGATAEMVNLDMDIHERLFGWNPAIVSQTIPPYSSDYGANAVVREWISENNWAETQRDNLPDGTLSIAFERTLPPGRVEALGANEMEATCRAALKIKGLSGK